jgi:hypothetical protein
VKDDSELLECPSYGQWNKLPSKGSSRLGLSGSSGVDVKLGGHDAEDKTTVTKE